MDPETEKKAFLNTLSNNNIDGFGKLKLKPDIFQSYFTNYIFKMPHARKMMTDFITLLRNEGIDNTDGQTKTYNSLATEIDADCKKNFSNTKLGDRICFCCGEEIITNNKGDATDVACDHVVPIITMLMTITPDSISNNLHYIHKRCNGRKSNKDIFTIYNEVGKPGGLFKCQKNNTQICKAKFISILKNLKLRDTHDIVHRVDMLHRYQEEVEALKGRLAFFLDSAKPAQVLMFLGNPNVKPVASVKHVTQKRNLPVIKSAFQKVDLKQAIKKTRDDDLIKQVIKKTRDDDLRRTRRLKRESMKNGTNTASRKLSTSFATTPNTVSRSRSRARASSRSRSRPRASSISRPNSRTSDARMLLDLANPGP
tara:strand:+ start:14 stop:1120 length:1107 start_codon:yes stop_codon:yes gene_type:complete